MMISWNSFKDAIPEQDILDKCDNKILICDTYRGFGNKPVKYIFVSDFHTGYGCYSKENGVYKNPNESTEEIFWSYLNKP